MRKSSILILAVIVCSLAKPVCAQTFAVLEGVIKDQTGAILPTAKLEIRSVGSGQRWNATSDGQGRYVFPNLATGAAELRAEFSGMQPYTQLLNLIAEQHLRLDITLGAAS